MMEVFQIWFATIRKLFAWALASTAILWQIAAVAAYPDHAIRLVVPFAAGSNIDGTARQIAPKISELLGQQVVVDNRAGASGIIGATIVATAPPDGYTILLGNAPTHGIAPNLYKKLAYDPVKDFAPVARLANSPYVLAVSSTLNINSIAGLISYAKANEGKVNYASTGNGTGVHLAGVLFNLRTGLNVAHIPYNNVGQMLGDIASGTVAMTFYPYDGLAPLMQSNKVQLLATTGARRASYLPKVPTMVESGFPDFVISAWHGLYAPAGTPPENIKILYEAVKKTMADPKVISNLATSGTDPDVASPAEFAAFTKNQIERYRQLIQLAGIPKD